MVTTHLTTHGWAYKKFAFDFYIKHLWKEINFLKSD